jgi:hypothetical protein
LFVKAFLAHVGHPGNIDIDFTVTRRRSVSDILEGLPDDAPERSFFSGVELRSAFPSGWFNCWGVPRGAAEEFKRMEVGDLVLIAPTIGVHDGGIHQLGVVKAICPSECFHASQVLWPQTPNDKLFPWVFLFESEAGYRSWYAFLNDIGYKEAYNPRGLFKSIADRKFERWGGVEGYLAFLRKDCKFKRLFPDEPSSQGAGFGTPEQNRLVEQAAVSAVKKWYSASGWDVLSVEKERCGFDLVCRKGPEEENAEVKGVRGGAQDFIITAGEVIQARENVTGVVWVVTEALSDSPTLNRYSGKEFIARFTLEPLQYRARLRH